MDPTIPWFSHRYDPVTPRKFELIPYVSERLGEKLSSGDQVSPGRFDPKHATLPSQPRDPRFQTPATAEGGASSSASAEQHQSRRRRVVRPRSMGR
jgi:hypothetical protein